LTNSFKLTDTIHEDFIHEQVLANHFMEQGNLAEFAGKSDPKSFAEAFRHMEKSLKSIDDGLKLYDVLLAKLEKNPTLPGFDKTLGKLFKEAEPVERISGRIGARYSDVGDAKLQKAPPPATRFDTLTSLMKAQREDLTMLRKLTADTVEAYKGVLPLTEKGEFVLKMLSGRSPFSERYEELVDARSTFAHSYARGCMMSIQAVMQNFPAGLEFLKGKEAK